MTLRLLGPISATLLWAVAISAVPSPALAQPALVSLRQGAELNCEPTLPYFCENMHVQCAGRTKTPTFAFKLRAESGTGEILLETEDAENRLRYSRATSVWENEESSLLLQPAGLFGYVKVWNDGKFVLRQYIGSRGVMALGVCR